MGGSLPRYFPFHCWARYCLSPSYSRFTVGLEEAGYGPRGGGGREVRVNVVNAGMLNVADIPD